MEKPKPKPPVQKPVSTPPEETKAEQPKKQSFKLKSHLTHRPFSDKAIFEEMRKKAESESIEKGTK